MENVTFVNSRIDAEQEASMMSRRLLCITKGLVGVALVLACMGTVHAAPREIPDPERAAQLRGPCETGESKACLGIASMLAPDYSVAMSDEEAKNVLPVVIQGCGIVRHADTDDAMFACLWAGEAYHRLNDYRNAGAYFQYACQNDFNKGCGRLKELQREQRYEAMREQERREWEAQQAREDAEFNRKLFGTIVKGISGIAASATEGQQRVEAARQGIILPPGPASAANDPIQASLANSLRGINAATASGAGTNDASEARRIASLCASRCSSQKSQCSAGGQAACYRAATCVCQCFLDNDTSGSPSRGRWAQCVRDNNARAGELAGGVTAVKPLQPAEPRAPRQDDLQFHCANRPTGCPDSNRTPRGSYRADDRPPAPGKLIESN